MIALLPPPEPSHLAIIALWILELAVPSNLEKRVDFLPNSNAADLAREFKLGALTHYDFAGLGQKFKLRALTDET